VISFLLPFPPKSYIHSSSHACYVPCPTYPSCLNHSNYIWRREQVMKLLITKSSPASYYFIPLQSKYSPQHPVLKYFFSYELMTYLFNDVLTTSQVMYH
jgi:hypothetical protein